MRPAPSFQATCGLPNFMLLEELLMRQALLAPWHLLFLPQFQGEVQQ